MELQRSIRARQAFSIYVLLFAASILLTTASLPAYPVQIFRVAVNDSVLGMTILLLRNIVVWFLAYLAYARLIAYAGEVQNTAENKALGKIATAIGLFGLSSALPGIVWRSVETFVLPGMDMDIFRRLLSTYTGLALTLAGFILLSNGLRHLSRQAGIKGSAYGEHGPLVATFVFIGAGFVYLMISSFERYNPPFSLLVLLLTIVAPYCLAWFLGSLCLNNVRLHMKKVPGFIYRPLFRWLGRGLVILILTQVAVQSIEGSFAYVTSLPHSLAIAIILALSVLQAISFTFIALGAKQLDKIETV